MLGYGKGVYYYSLRGVMPHDDANDGLVSKKHGDVSERRVYPKKT